MQLDQILTQNVERLTQEEVVKSIYTDTLTGCYNRAALEYDEQKFFAIIDFDSLGYINDNFGHDCGDFQLREFSQMLKDTFGTENVFRIGGDEFVVKGSDLHEFAEKVIKACEENQTFTYGIGNSMRKADLRLIFNKQIREGKGLRAKKGQQPPWIENIEVA